MALAVLFASCRPIQKPKTPADKDYFTTVTISNVTANAADFSARLLTDSTTKMISCGFCWSSATPEPTLKDEMHPCIPDTASNEIRLVMAIFEPQTTYYVRAYIMLADSNIYYSAMAQFTTLKAETPAYSLETVECIETGTTYLHVTSSLVGDIESAEITAYGFCYCYESEGVPTIESYKVACEDMSVTGFFDAFIEELTVNSTFNVRPYANVNGEVIYGDTRAFTTNSGSGDEPALVISELYTGNRYAIHYRIDINGDLPESLQLSYSTTTGFDPLSEGTVVSVDLEGGEVYENGYGGFGVSGWVNNMPKDKYYFRAIMYYSDGYPIVSEEVEIDHDWGED